MLMTQMKVRFWSRGMYDLELCTFNEKSNYSQVTAGLLLSLKASEVGRKKLCFKSRQFPSMQKPSPGVFHSGLLLELWGLKAGCVMKASVCAAGTISSEWKHFTRCKLRSWGRLMRTLPRVWGVWIIFLIGATFRCMGNEFASAILLN